MLAQLHAEGDCGDGDLTLAHRGDGAYACGTLVVRFELHGELHDLAGTRERRESRPVHAHHHGDARVRRGLEQEHAGGLGEAFQHVDAGQHRIAGEMLGEHVVAQRDGAHPTARTPGSSDSMRSRWKWRMR